MIERDSFKFLGISIDRLSYEKFLQIVSDALHERKKITIGYANADTINKTHSDPELKNILNSFDFVHPDGIGIYIASRIKFGRHGLKTRITGSDFYNMLVEEAIKRKWRFFFFGHSNEILGSIQECNPGLVIAGMNEGYHFKSEDVINKINESKTEILIIGLSCPKQEKWMSENSHKISCNVILAVGDGVKVFAGRKIRGPVLMRKLGFEWLVRLVSHPMANFKKYFIGVPLFAYRVFRS